MQRSRRRTARKTIGLALAATLTLAIPANAHAGDLAAPSTATAVKTKPDPYPTMYEVFGQDSLENGKFMWKDGATEVDRVVLILSDQMIFAYDKDEMVGVSTVSTGRPGRETRPGSFRILAKHRYYRSKKYDNAPMPYMQQITDYGVALHGGHLPGYPASHGCIRLPVEFAAKLFAVTQIGTPVVIEQ